MKSGSSKQGGKYVISFINCAVKKSKKHNCKNHNKRAILSQNHNLLAHVAKNHNIHALLLPNSQHALRR